MIELTFLFVAVLVLLIVAIYLLGFRVGGEQRPSEDGRDRLPVGEKELSPVTRIRMESADARRRMRDIDAAAYAAMVNHVVNRQRPRDS